MDKIAYIPLRNSGAELKIYGRYFDFLEELSFKVVAGGLKGGDLDVFSLLLLPGGGDLGDLNADAKSNDKIDLGLCKVFNDRKIFGICRGLQVYNVYRGGTLKEVEGHQNTEHQLSGMTKMVVNSFHHQAIDILAPKLNPFLTSGDGVIEGVRDKDFLGFQFHPELLIGENKERVKRIFISWLKGSDTELDI